MRLVDAELGQRVAAQRKQVDELRGSLEPRRAAEAAELAELAKRKDALGREAQRLSAETRRFEASTAQAEQERVALTAGLSAARRTWLRLVEPLVASMVLFFCIVVIGVAEKQRQLVLLLELSGALAGSIVGRAAGRFRALRP